MNKVQELENFLGEIKQYQYQEYENILYVNGKPYHTQSYHPAMIEGRSVFSKQEIDSFNLENIDPVSFWKTVQKHFPIANVSGHGHMTVNNLNDEDFISNWFSTFEIPINKLKNSIIKSDSVVLEIGPGYGWLHNKLFKDNKNYHALDLVQRFKCLNFHLGDGFNIPESIPDLDIVFSVNCIQHLFEKQLDSYFEQIFKKLKNNGVLIFTTFVQDDDNRGWRDEDGNRYGMFLGQFNKTFSTNEIIEKLRSNGYTNISSQIYYKSSEDDVMHRMFVCSKEKTNGLCSLS